MIGTSDGKTYDDEFHYALENLPAKTSTSPITSSYGEEAQSADFNWQEHWNMLNKLGGNYKAPGNTSEGSENLMDRRDEFVDEEIERRRGASEYNYQKSMDEAFKINQDNSGNSLSRAAGYNDILTPEAKQRYADESKEIKEARLQLIHKWLAENPDIAARFGGKYGGEAGTNLALKFSVPSAARSKAQKVSDEQ